MQEITSAEPVKAAEPLLASLTDQEIRFRLVIEVGKIDPPNAESIVGILWDLFKPNERIRALDSRGFLAAKYGVAKRELERRRGASSPEQTACPSEIQGGTDGDEGDNEDDKEGATDGGDPAGAVNLIPIQEMTVDALASRPASDIMAHLSSPAGTEILQKLRMRRPTSSEATDLARWILVTFDRPPAQRTAHIAAMIAEHLGVSLLAKLTRIES